MTDPIETLESQLAAAADGPAKIDALNALAWELRYDEPERATTLSQEARQLSQAGRPTNPAWPIACATWPNWLSIAANTRKAWLWPLKG